MSFNGTEGSPITLAQGKTLTSNYRRANPNTTKGVFIGIDHINSLLAQTGAKGIRIYFGNENSPGNTIVLVAADSNENDILDLIINSGKQGPPYSGNANDLNS
jgi:hypothetical protein